MIIGNDVVNGDDGDDLIVGDFGVITVPIVLEAPQTKKEAKELEKDIKNLLKDVEKFVLDKHHHGHHHHGHKHFGKAHLHR